MFNLDKKTRVKNVKKLERGTLFCKANVLTLLSLSLLVKYIHKYYNLLSFYGS